MPNKAVQSGTSENPPIREGSNPVQHLLARMRMGDREAAAEFMHRFGERIRRRVHGRLQPRLRRLFDSQELTSTLARRLDLLVRHGKLKAANESQLWALVFTMAEHALIDKYRSFARLLSIESSVEVARQMGGSDSLADHGRRDDGALTRAFSELKDSTDRDILSLWLQDTPHIITAKLVGLSPAAVRKRWEFIKRRLHRTFARE